MLGLPPRGRAWGPVGRLGRSGRGDGRLCDRSWPADLWPGRTRAPAWDLPPRSAALRRPKPRPRGVRSPRWPPGSPRRDAPLGGRLEAFVCRRGRWRRRRCARLPSPPGRAARRPLDAPWRRPLPREPPCAQGPYVAPPWSCGPSLRMRALSVFVSERPWQLFGLSLPKEGRDDLTASCGLFGPGPEPVCRARPVDSTTADKIQGPELRCPALQALPLRGGVRFLGLAHPGAQLRSSPTTGRGSRAVYVRHGTHSTTAGLTECNRLRGDAVYIAT